MTRPEEIGEREAFRDMLRAAPPEIGATALERGELLGIGVPSLPVPLLNRVMGATGELPDDELDEVTAFFAGTRHYVAVLPGDDALRGRLAARGYTPDYHWQKFARDPRPVPRRGTELRIGDVGPERAEEFGSAFVAGYGVPPVFAPWLAAIPGREGWHCFGGFAGDALVAVGALYVTGRVGWAGMGATHPDHRGRGGQGAILAARVARAAELDLDVVVTETGVRSEGRVQTSFDNIERVGFVPTYVRENWLSPQPAGARPG